MRFISKGWVILVDTNFMSDSAIKELIGRRRRQILVHSVIYYKLNENLIDDATWSRWALELEELQKHYPQLAMQCPLNDAFIGFDHSTGMSLPLENPWAVRKAQYLVDLARSSKTRWKEKELKSSNL